MPVSTHPHLLVVGAGNLTAVLGMARLGARRGEIRRLRSADHQLPGSLTTEGFSKYRRRQDLPLGWSDISFQGCVLLEYSHVCVRDMYPRGCFAATRVRTDVSWWRALELAEDNREAPHGHSAQ
jgi:hypothetical protein